MTYRMQVHYYGPPADSKTSIRLAANGFSRNLPEQESICSAKVVYIGDLCADRKAWRWKAALGAARYLVGPLVLVL